MFYFKTYFCYLGFVEMYFDGPIVLDAKTCCEAGGWVNFLPLFEKCFYSRNLTFLFGVGGNLDCSHGILSLSCIERSFVAGIKDCVQISRPLKYRLDIW